MVLPSQMRRGTAGQWGRGRFLRRYQWGFVLLVIVLGAVLWSVLPGSNANDRVDDLRAASPNAGSVNSAPKAAVVPDRSAKAGTSSGSTRTGRVEEKVVASKPKPGPAVVVKPVPKPQTPVAKVRPEPKTAPLSKVRGVETPRAASAPAALQPARAGDNSGSDGIDRAIGRAQAQVAAGKLVEARQMLSRLLDAHGASLNAQQARGLQEALNKTAAGLFWNRKILPSDEVVQSYLVRPGDSFGRIGKQFKVPYLLIMRMNGARNDRSLRAHSRIKVPKGPLHAVITKTAYRMDVFGDGRDGKRLYVCSFNVGLGKDDSTPVGRWVVGRGKQINPDWRNPITHEYHRADDPVNPIGEHWIPLHGTEERTRSMTGYGIHGTIEPESIGTQSSMGCVRLLPADVEQVYQLLAPEHSRVETRD